MRRKKIYSVLIMTAVFVSLLSVPAYASGDVAGASRARGQLRPSR